MTVDIAVMQAMRLKGRPTVAHVAAAVGQQEQEVQAQLNRLLEAGDCEETNDRFWLTRPGRERLNTLIEEERAGVDEAQLRGLYDEFASVNSEFKAVVTDWQLRDGEPNDHSDESYDRQIVERLVALDQGFAPLLERIVATAPRLAPYSARFAGALERVQAGDHSWIARPIADSYHTVWFELHEELIGLLGLSREAEAASGRAE